MSEDFVLAELKALKDADAGLEPSADVEARLVGTFRRRKILRSWKRSAALGAVAAGVFAIITIPRPRLPQPVAVVSAPAVAEIPPAPAEKPMSVKVTRPTRTSKVRASAHPGEVATEFFPLMDTPPPFERGELLRVVVPAEAMREVGLPVGEDHLADPVQADILVGQEGLARAIRFVSFQP
jgi:hypothetical protein